MSISLKNLGLKKQAKNLDWTAGVFYTNFEERVKEGLTFYIPFDPTYGTGYATSVTNR